MNTRILYLYNQIKNKLFWRSQGTWHFEHGTSQASNHHDKFEEGTTAETPENDRSERAVQTRRIREFRCTDRSPFLCRASIHVGVIHDLQDTAQCNNNRASRHVSHASWWSREKDRRRNLSSHVETVHLCAEPLATLEARERKTLRKMWTTSSESCTTRIWFVCVLGLFDDVPNTSMG